MGGRRSPRPGVLAAEIPLSEAVPRAAAGGGGSPHKRSHGQGKGGWHGYRAGRESCGMRGRLGQVWVSGGEGEGAGVQPR